MTEHTNHLDTSTTAAEGKQRWHAVRVHQADGRFHDDQIRGTDRAEAMTNAHRNWITETPAQPAAWVEYIDPDGLSAAALIAACLDGDLGEYVRDQVNGALTCATERGFEHDEARVLDTLRAYLDAEDDPPADSDRAGEQLAGDAGDGPSGQGVPGTGG